ncbi:MAG: transcriptional repressor LexA [Akkermansia sp.]
MSKDLTTRQFKLLSFLHAYQSEHKIMPSTREIQKHFGFASQTAAMSYLKALERKGAIIRHTNKARAIVLTDMFESSLELFDNQQQKEQEQHTAALPSIPIPIYGCIAAGMSQDIAPEREGSITLDLSRLGKPQSKSTFALRVRGESMIDAAICDGDIVILEPRAPKPGDIVAALIDGGTTLKRYMIRDNQPCLHAENPLFPNLIPVRELQIQGVVVALVRSL